VRDRWGARSTGCVQPVLPGVAIRGTIGAFLTRILAEDDEGFHPQPAGPRQSSAWFVPSVVLA